MSNVLAIDVGYGHVKWVAIGPSGETKRGIFPSVAPITTRERTVETSGLAGHRTVTVNVGEHNYVVGRDAYLEADAHFSRPRLSDYSQTDGYRALMLGAMVFSGMREIDQLVVGLPLTTLTTYHAQLQEQYTGEHTIGASYAKRKVDVNVGNVTVTSQPAGAMLHAAAIDPSLRKKTNLVIDMGYFTMDFLMCDGLRPYYARSGAIQGGMSGYYDHLGGMVVDQLAKAGVGKKSGVDHFRLEKALTEVDLSDAAYPIYQLMTGNQSVDITESVTKAKTKLNDYLDRMITGLAADSLEVVNSIVLAGGGGGFIGGAIKTRLGNTHQFVELSNGQFAIAQGYAALGIAAAKRMSVAA